MRGRGIAPEGFKVPLTRLGPAVLATLSRLAGEGEIAARKKQEGALLKQEKNRGSRRKPRVPSRRHVDAVCASLIVSPCAADPGSTLRIQIVMTGLVPAIHALLVATLKTWIPGIMYEDGACAPFARATR